jgi:23S rRNA pseudouridine2605 synthase
MRPEENNWNSDEKKNNDSTRDSGSNPRPERTNDYNRERPAYNSERPRTSSFNRDSNSSRPYNSDRPSRPSYNSDRPARPAFNGERSDRPAYNADRPARPSYNSDRPARPSYNQDRSGGFNRNFNRNENDRPAWNTNKPSEDSDSPRRSYNRPDQERNNFSSFNNEDPSKPRRPRFRVGDTPQEGENSSFTPRNNSGDEQRSAGYQSRPSYGNREGGYQSRPSYGNREEGSSRPSYGNREGGYQSRPSYGNREEGSSRPSYGNREGGFQSRPSYGNREEGSSRPSYGNREGGFQSRPSYGNREGGNSRPSYGNREGGSRPSYGNREGGYQGRPSYGNREGGYHGRPSFGNREGGYDPNAKYSKKKQFEFKEKNIDPNEPIRLNKYLANAGLCSRREADEFIQAGVVAVNGAIVTELGTKVKREDKVLFHDQLVSLEHKVYVLLNKPKDCVTTTDDPQARLTVMHLVRNACKERIYPVGRLDRNTTGVLLLTNDGELASKLTHPKFVKKKIYQVTLEKPLTAADMEKIREGIELEDGEIHADEIHYIKDEKKTEVGIEIHSGRNRIVRRIFEHLGYKVYKLDRVYFAGLTKKGLARGKFRHLNDREVNMLLMGAFD